MKRKVVAVLLTLAMVVGMTGCGTAENTKVEEKQEMSVEEEKTEEAENDSEETTDVAEDTDAENVEEVAEDEKPQRMILMPDVVVGKCDLPESEALDFVKDMKIGWNLGNTMDAQDSANKADEMEFESYWCGIKTTKEMIDAIKGAGFNTLRVPISWHNHVSDDGTYTISEAWMNRVQEIVDYAFDNDMYVIINIHHDNSKKFMYPTREYMDQSKAYVQAVWQQVATRFADYDDHLIMEALNEPRMVDTQYEWWLDLQNEQCIESVECINELEQLFVDTVRATGGNNATRYLMVPGYSGSPQGVSTEHFVMPKDVAGNENKILIEVHAYTPYNFALQSMKESGSTDKFSIYDAQNKFDINDVMNTLYTKFTKQGIGVVIDEFGSVNKNDNLQARVDHAAFFVASARARGITCCWWDNNIFAGDGELFGIFDRSTCTFPFPEIMDVLMKYAE